MCAGAARGWRSATPTRARLLASDDGRGAARRGRGVRAAALPRGRAAASRGGRCSRAPRSAGRAEERGGRPPSERLEIEPKGRERKAIERELEEAAKRDGRRARTEVLDLALELTALGFRDLVCLAEERPTAVLAPTAAVARERARGRDPRRLREAVERCEDTRQALELNVTEDLALTALGLGWPR